MIVRALERNVQPSRKHVPLNLSVPSIRHKLLEPLRKSGKFRRGKIGNCRLEIFNVHVVRWSNFQNRRICGTG